MTTPLYLRVLPLLRRYRVFGTFGVSRAVVYRCDGTSFHGGLCDRFKGIVTAYAFAKATGRPYKIYYTFPFELKEFLVPASVDWELKEGELCETMFGVALRRFCGSETIEPMKEVEHSWRQLHFYASRDHVGLVNEEYGTEYTFGGLFRELFKPSEVLAASLAEKRKKLGEKYIGAHLRFQSLLGDFDEYEYSAKAKKSVHADYPTLGEAERRELIERCKAQIIKLHEETGRQVLVLSDSGTFLREMAGEEGVVVFPSRSIHIDAKQEGVGTEDYMKVFDDFFLLSGAEQIYSLTTGQMYRSDFPLIASRVGGGEFKRVEF